MKGVWLEIMSTINNICIGIISYLPDDKEVRDVRYERVVNLFKEIDEKLNLPVILIAQNWKTEDLANLHNKKVIFHSYEQKLGITNARNELRNKFLESEFSHIIMIDDDLKLGTKEECKKYLAEIEQYNCEFYCVDKFLINYSCLSRQGFTKVGYDFSYNAEKGTGFEDWIFEQKCKKLLTYHIMQAKINCGVRQDYLNDKYSTWTPLDESLKNSNEINSRIAIAKIKRVQTN